MALRHYLVVGINRANMSVGIVATLAVGALFFAAQFWGTMPIPEAEFVDYLKSRMADPSRTDLLGFSYIWYQPLSKEISDTWGRMPSNILGVVGTATSAMNPGDAVIVDFHGEATSETRRKERR